MNRALPTRPLFTLAFAPLLSLAFFTFVLARLRDPGAAAPPLRGLAWPAAVAIAIGAAAAPEFRARARQSRGLPSEMARWCLLAGAGLYLAHPYLTPMRVGAGDAQDYAQTIADFLQQVRDGQFPVLVGQSGFAFDGAFNPLRTAPLLPYAAGLLHAATGRTLGVYALQNLLVVSSLTAAGFSAYACLRRLLPERGWTCMALASLYLSCPGVLALAYSGDMIPSWLTLPLLPAACHLAIRVANGAFGARHAIAIAAVTAALWLAHAPIAMWTSAGILAAVGWRTAIAWRHGRRGELLALAAGAAVFLLLAGFEFASVSALALPRLEGFPRVYRDGTVQELLRQGFHGWGKPVSPDGAHLISDLKLSPGIWLCQAVAAAGWRRASAGSRLLLIGCGVLIAMLIPAPWPSDLLWHLVPVRVMQVTDLWPMQRFLPIVSACAPLILAAAWRDHWPRSLLSRDIAWAVAASCLVWSLVQAQPFLDRGRAAALDLGHSHSAILEKNAVMSVYSAALLGRPPPSFPTRPEMMLRWNGDNGQRIDDRATLLRSQERPVASLSFRPTWYGAEGYAPLTLPRGEYLFVLSFHEPVPEGTLTVEGDTLRREYPVPVPVGAGAFPGTGAPGQRSIAITVGAESERIKFRFDAKRPPSPPIDDLAGINVLTFSPESLPLRLNGLAPLRFEVEAPGPGWVDTPRLFIPGYRAEVGGREAQVGRSREGLLSVRVPAGTSKVVVAYPGTFWTRVSFWVGACAWAALIVAAPFLAHHGTGADEGDAWERLVARYRRCVPPRRPTTRQSKTAASRAPVA